MPLVRADTRWSVFGYEKIDQGASLVLQDFLGDVSGGWAQFRDNTSKVPTTPRLGAKLISAWRPMFWDNRCESSERLRGAGIYGRLFSESSQGRTSPPTILTPTNQTSTTRPSWLPLLTGQHSDRCHLRRADATGRDRQRSIPCL